MIVVITVSRRVGQLTLAASERTSWKNRAGLLLAIASNHDDKGPRV
jgi:hypothetical protein